MWILWILLGIFAWVWLGFYKIPLAWEGRRLVLGSLQRGKALLGEWAKVSDGWQWAAWPLSIKIEDVREKVVPLETIDATTSDNAIVYVVASIARKIVDLDEYLGVDPTDLKVGIDDLAAENIRSTIRSKPLSDVLGMQMEVSKSATQHLQDNLQWGLKITRVNVAGITTSPEMAQDLEKKLREQLQREGEKVEAAHTVELIALYHKPIEEGGGGASPSDAREQANLTTKRVSKTIEAKTYGIDDSIANVLKVGVDKILGGK